MRTWKTGVVAISDWEMVILTNPQFSHGMPQLHQGVKNARRFTGAIKLFWSCISNNKNMGYDIPGICNFFTVYVQGLGLGISCIFASDHQDASIFNWLQSREPSHSPFMLNLRVFELNDSNL